MWQLYREDDCHSSEEKNDSDIVREIRDDGDVNNILEQAFAVFNEYSAWGLRDMAIKETPWLEAARGSVCPETIKKYFRDFTRQQGKSEGRGRPGLTFAPPDHGVQAVPASCRGQQIIALPIPVPKIPAPVPESKAE